LLKSLDKKIDEKNQIQLVNNFIIVYKIKNNAKIQTSLSYQYTHKKVHLGDERFFFLISWGTGKVFVPLWAVIFFKYMKNQCLWWCLTSHKVFEKSHSLKKTRIKNQLSNLWNFGSSSYILTICINLMFLSDIYVHHDF
jgi:hypothetical protein